MATRKTRSGPAAEAKQARAAALNDSLEEFLAALLEEHDGDEDAMAEALAAMLKGKPYTEKYSERNAMLIVMQDPEATDVRGFVQWQSAGRAVRAYPEGQGGLTIVAYRGGDKDKDAEGDAPAEAGKGRQPGEVSSDDLKPSRKWFALDTVHDVRFTDPVACGTCGEPIHRTGKETREQMQARGGRRQAALWAHTSTKPADGHAAARDWAAEQAKAQAAA